MKTHDQMGPLRDVDFPFYHWNQLKVIPWTADCVQEVYPQSSSRWLFTFFIATWSLYRLTSFIKTRCTS